MSSLGEKDIIEVFKEVKVGLLMLFRSRRSEFSPILASAFWWFGVLQAQ